MPRIRSIKPEFFTSSTVAQLSFRQMILFEGLWVYCDDQGRGLDDPRLIKAAVWPQRDDVTVEDVAADLTELNARGFIVRYDEHTSAARGLRRNTVENSACTPLRFVAIPTWKTHQRVSHPAKSKYPAPPRVSRKSPEGLRLPLEGLVPEVEVGSGTGNREQGKGTGNMIAAAGAGRTRDPLWEVLAEELGPVTNDAERGRRNKALKLLRQSEATPDELRGRIVAARIRWNGEAEVTAMGIATNWSDLGKERMRLSKSERGLAEFDAIADRMAR